MFFKIVLKEKDFYTDTYVVSVNNNSVQESTERAKTFAESLVSDELKCGVPQDNLSCTVTLISENNHISFFQSGQYKYLVHL